MSYIGNQPTQVAFLVDTFTGNSSTTAFTMSVAPANPASIIVAISGVVQDPATYSVGGTTLTFSTAPPTGTGNISVRYLGIPASGVATTAYRTVTNFTATAAQTTFTPPSYTAGFINVYRNGVYLPTVDYTATNGTTIVLNNGCASGDTVTIESFLVSSVLNAIPATAGSVGSTYLASNLTLTSPTMTSPTMSGAVVSAMASSVLTLGTSQASTSGTSITFSSIPSWVKRITVMFNGVSTSGTSLIQIQIGSGSVTNSGYVSGAHTSNNVDSSSTTGFIQQASNVASTTYSGIAMILLSAANTYTCSGSLQPPGAAAGGNMSGGWITIGGALDRVVITTVNGTDTFDAGSINIQYE
jgi:hypothetical protein